MANKLLEYNPWRLSMIGGLSKFVIARLPYSLADTFVEPLEAPEVGAILYAKCQWQEEQKVVLLIGSLSR